jgi:6-phosphogluconolactonase
MNTIYCGDWDFKGQLQGVKAFIQNSKTGRWEEKGVYGDQPGQSILTIAGDWLISICELSRGGKVVSYRIEEDGSLSQRYTAAFDSAKLSYVVASPNGKYVFVSSMGDGTVKMIRLGEHGELTLTDEFKLTGHSVTPRQAQAKVHSVMITPDGTLLAAANLGADEVELFQVDYEKEILRLSDSRPVDFGREPRHMAFHPEGKYLYVLTEGGNRLYVYTLQAGKLREMATYETRSLKGEQKGAAADILVSRDGKFIYATNRGQHNIAVWKILNSGLLDIVAYCGCGGQGPRGICFSADGKWMFSANNEDGTVTVLPVDQETGLLGEPCQKLEVPLAGCVRFCP